jgi:hypothetical protein
VAERWGVAVALGVVLGFLASRLILLQWATLIPWGIAGLAVGAISRDRRQALVAGALYGFALGLTFMAAGYGGSEPLLTRVPFFAIIGVVCAPFGAALGLVGQWLAMRMQSARGPAGR